MLDTSVASCALTTGTSELAAVPFICRVRCRSRALVVAIQDAEERAAAAEQVLGRERELRAKVEAELAKVKAELEKAQAAATRTGAKRSRRVQSTSE